MDSEAYRLLKAAIDKLKEGDSEEALSDLRAACEAASIEGPNVSATVARSAAVFYEQHGRLADAEQAIEAAAMNDPHDGLTALVLAGLKLRLGHTAAAIAEFNRAKRIAEDSGDEALKVMIEQFEVGTGGMA